jgi:hypothetical protein
MIELRGETRRRSVTVFSLPRKGLEKKSAHVDAFQSFELAVVQATASAKARWISNPMMRMPAPPFVRLSGSWWGDTTSIDPRSQRIREKSQGAAM